MLNKLLHNGFIKTILWIGCLGSTVLLVLFLLVLLIVPIGNYYHTQAAVELKDKRSIVAEFDGVIENVFIKNGSITAKDSTVLQYSSRETENRLAELKVRETFLKKEIRKLKRLHRNGYISKGELSLKEVEVSELQTRIENLSETTLLSPDSGKIYYNILPEEIVGSYVHKGQVIAYLFRGDTKQIHVEFPISRSDKIALGTDVVVRYKDPASLKALKLKGTVYQKEFEIKEQTVHLYCTIKGDGESLERLPHATRVDVSVLVNEKSIFEDLFNVDILSYIAPSLKRRRLVSSVEEQPQ